MIRRHVTVHGVVHGVGFRYSCARAARQLGVAGWVRNRPDGTVEAVFEGEEDAVERLSDWMRAGPPGAEVTALDVVAERPRGERDFEIRAAG